MQITKTRPAKIIRRSRLLDCCLHVGLLRLAAAALGGGPVNDQCANSLPIVAGETIFSTIDATTDGAANALCFSSGNTQIQRDIWFHYTAGCTGTLVLDTCGSDFDTKLAVYQSGGCVGPIVGCNDGYLYCENSQHASLRINVTQGQTYKIRVGSQGAVSGTGVLFLQCGCLNPTDCRDTFFCNGLEFCDSGFCLPGGLHCEPFEVCNESTHECEPAACDTSPECNDNQFCNGAETCVEGFCSRGIDPCDACACNGSSNMCVCPCPSGTMTFVNPPNGAVDAGQPHPVHSVEPRQGVQTLTAIGPSGALGPCFTLCESSSMGSPNAIASVEETNGTYTISLARIITPGAVTRITYSPLSGQPSVGRFIFHPGNVNGDSIASPLDILRIVDCQNGINPSVTCPWGLLSRDADRSGVGSASDILRVIDLLNGAGEFTPWNNTFLPTGCP